ncbi:MAG TPA: dihydroxyacetone kinase phosphoryl donor subunit DhaM [Humibacter sp.]|nr:dihydroxyacetone kinase phosphoryl donor subunit DhaM [Humibacter sp.]
MTDAEQTTHDRVAVVIVSHSAQIAAGTAALARQMAPNVALEEAGGTDEDQLGTSFDLVSKAIERALRGSSAVVLCDIGSAVLTAETAIDLMSERDRVRVRIADAPIVEGAIAAAVAAQTGQSLDGVVEAAEAARPASPRGSRTSATGGPVPVTSDADADRYVRRATLTNADGLHARPAAEFVRLAATFPVKVMINGKDAKSLLGIMSLGLMRGATVEISAEPDGATAVDALAELIESGFAGKETR